MATPTASVSAAHLLATTIPQSVLHYLRGCALPLRCAARKRRWRFPDAEGRHGDGAMRKGIGERARPSETARAGAELGIGETELRL